MRISLTGSEIFSHLSFLISEHFALMENVLLPRLQLNTVGAMQHTAHLQLQITTTYYLFEGEAGRQKV